MSNKTCGECQWYDYHHLLCVVGGDVKPTDCVCDSFIPIKRTNGDVIRAIADNKKFAYYICEVSTKHKLFTADALADWLNAPAESEGEDE